LLLLTTTTTAGWVGFGLVAMVYFARGWPAGQPAKIVKMCVSSILTKVAFSTTSILGGFSVHLGYPIAFWAGNMTCEKSSISLADDA
jgi:hypothetical protein